MEPIESPLWNAALDQLEGENPERLEGLLQSGRLREHLDNLVRRAWALEQSLKDRNVDRIAIQEHVSHLLIQNAERTPDQSPDPPPLSPKVERLLAEFRENVSDEAESLPD